LQMPKLVKIRQSFNSEYIADIEGTVREQINSLELFIKPGASIAIAVGSRGIANIRLIVKATVDALKEKGAKPFIVPAMGSHGGATAEGQKEVLESYGVTEEYTGAPVKSSMQTAELPQGGLKTRVYMDRYAYESDGVVVINRIKVHTDFHGAIESGLLKMCVIGLGKHRQALELHKHGTYGLRELVPATAREVLKSGKIILGIGIVENAYDRTMIIKAVLPPDMEREEIKLLEISRRNMPRFPVQQIDVLIVDEMGKDISGIGIDSNITGRIRIRGEQDPVIPDIASIVVTDLTEASHGNALGVGLADFITRNLHDKIDFKATYENVLTSTFVERGKIPIVADTDLKAAEYALRTCGAINTEAARIIRIKNTLRLNELYVSKSVFDEVKDQKNIEIAGDFEDMFDACGKLVKF
jgi:hypothetical protein